MTIHELHLTGCSPTPLAWYLKGIAILRLVAEQADPNARGAWRDEHFVLWSTLDRDALLQFFAEQYAPTPMISPWNKGSGFMGSAQAPVEAILNSTAQRFEVFRSAIADANALTGAMVEADALIRSIKDESKGRHLSKAEKEAIEQGNKERLRRAERRFATLKAELIPDSRRQWRGPHHDWIEAALVLTDANEAKFPSILGTGGNDGRFDMTNNAMQRLGELFDLSDPAGLLTDTTLRQLSVALFGEIAPTGVRAPVGQFFPGAAGGANSSSSPQGGSARVNPWDFLLSLEGSVAFRSYAARRLGGTESVLAAAPFAAYNHASGYGSSAREEKNRGEQWMPLWSRPVSWPELRSLFGEARTQVGRHAASRPLDLARAFTRLGVARGLEQFVRYGYMERYGQSNLAVPLDRISVGDSPRTRLVDDIATWLDRLGRSSQAQNATASLQNGERRLSDAVFEALKRPDEARVWQAVLLAMADIEALIVPGTSRGIDIIPKLGGGWIEAADDGSPEFRLGLALGLATVHGDRQRAVSVRRHFLPLTQGGRLHTTGGLSPTIIDDPDVVFGGPPLDALLNLVSRRMITGAGSGASRRYDISAHSSAPARLSDIVRFIDGQLDVPRIVALARAFSAVDRRASIGRHAVSGDILSPDDAWIMLRLAYLPDVPDLAGTPGDPAIIRRLQAGDGAGALQIALRRLISRGWVPPISFGYADQEQSRRWGAALAFPLSDSSYERLSNPFSLHKEQDHAR